MFIVGPQTHRKHNLHRTQTNTNHSMMNLEDE